MADETPDTPDTPDASADDAVTDASAVAVEEVPAIDPAVAALFERFEAALGDGVVDHADSFGTLVVRVKPDAWKRAAEVARADLDCDYLSFISGIDWMPAPKPAGDEGGDTSAPVQPDTMTFGVTGSDGRLQVFAHVQSTTRHWGVTIKTDVADPAPTVDSWVSVYPGADWHERECWEMYGVDFSGHPKIRHLYLPGEFEGNPLRKDFALLAREVKPWPGLVDVEPMPGDDTEEGDS
ncbi:MAG: NADH-quinone oxidoreductase subunit C [Acidimicrobiia bacterium]|nr:NADH-quinone oxidoreductase subunit C [Acidimicrobiia bacterium]